MPYPEAVNLPFNRACLQGDFRPLSPETPDDGQSGILLLLQGEQLVVREEAGKLLLPIAPCPSWVRKDSMIAIGTWQGTMLRAGMVPQSITLPHPFVAEPFNAVTDRLDDRQLTLGGIARQLLSWERDSSRCPRCGSATERVAGGWGKRCTACGSHRFPPIHPCVIVLVRRGAEFLLGRKSSWPEGRYSLVAGFLDAGESLEECVHREVREETGVDVTNLRYVGSQFWPFPSQLMAGFVAEYAGGEVMVDGDELEDARWFSTDSLPESLPGKRSIARWIIDHHALGR